MKGRHPYVDSLLDETKASFDVIDTQTVDLKTGHLYSACL
jgi:hypothetical protein